MTQIRPDVRNPAAHWKEGGGEGRGEGEGVLIQQPLVSVDVTDSCQGSSMGSICKKTKCFSICSIKGRQSIIKHLEEISVKAMDAVIEYLTEYNLQSPFSTHVNTLHHVHGVLSVSYGVISPEINDRYWGQSIFPIILI